VYQAASPAVLLTSAARSPGFQTGSLAFPFVQATSQAVPVTSPMVQGTSQAVQMAIQTVQAISPVVQIISPPVQLMFQAVQVMIRAVPLTSQAVQATSPTSKSPHAERKTILFSMFSSINAETGGERRRQSNGHRQRRA